MSLLAICDRYNVITLEAERILHPSIFENVAEIKEAGHVVDHKPEELKNHINSKVKMQQLKRACNRLETCFQPLHENLNMFLYFHTKGSFIFEQSLLSNLSSASCQGCTVKVS